MSQENVPNKPVHLIYLCSGLTLFYLFQWTGEWLWGYFTRTPSEFYITVGSALLSLFLGIYYYRNEKVYTLITEVTAELKKVTWPGAKDVKQATIVVVIMTIISASILGFFDLIWSRLTQLIYG